MSDKKRHKVSINSFSELKNWMSNMTENEDSETDVEEYKREENGIIRIKQNLYPFINKNIRETFKYKKELEKFETDITDANSLINQEDMVEEKNPLTPEISSSKLDFKLQEFKNQAFVEPPVENEKGEIEKEREYIENITDKYVSGTLNTIEINALLRVKHRKDILDLVKSHDKIKQSCLHLLQNVGIKVPYTVVKDNKVKSDYIIFSEEQIYDDDTVIRGIIYLVSDIKRKIQQNTKYETDINNYQSEVVELNDQIKTLQNKISSLEKELKNAEDRIIEINKNEYFDLQEDHSRKFVIYDKEKQVFLSYSGRDEDISQSKSKYFSTDNNIKGALKLDSYSYAEFIILSLKKKEKVWRNKKKKYGKRIPSRVRRNKYRGPRTKNLSVYEIVLKKIT